MRPAGKRVFLEFQRSNIGSPDTHYESLRGTNLPIRSNLLETSHAEKTSKYRNYISRFPTVFPKPPAKEIKFKFNKNIFMPNNSPDVSRDAHDPAVQPNSPEFCPAGSVGHASQGGDLFGELSFLNINLRNANPHKLDNLTKSYNDIAIFLLNEIHINTEKIDIICPAGYKIKHSKADADLEAYCAVLYKEELDVFAHQIVPNCFFLCKVLFKFPDKKLFFRRIEIIPK